MDILEKVLVESNFRIDQRSESFLKSKSKKSTYQYFNAKLNSEGVLDFDYDEDCGACFDGRSARGREPLGDLLSRYELHTHTDAHERLGFTTELVITKDEWGNNVYTPTFTKNDEGVMHEEVLV